MAEGLFGLLLLVAAGLVGVFALVGNAGESLSREPLQTSTGPARDGYNLMGTRDGAPASGPNASTPSRSVEPVSTKPTSRDHPAFTGQLQWTRADCEHVIGLASARWGVPAEILAGLCFAESSFNPRARSGAGAFGPFQFLIPTATEEMRKEGFRLIAEDLQDVGLSAYLCARYLVWLRNYLGAGQVEIDRLDEWRPALSGYNMGPGNVRKGLLNKGYENKIIKYARERGFVILVDRMTRDPWGDASVA